MMRPVDIRPVQAVREAGGTAEFAHGRQPSPQGGKEADVEVVRSRVLSANQPPFDAERVAAVRQALATGAYSLSPADIAEAMIVLANSLRSKS